MKKYSITFKPSSVILIVNTVGRPVDSKILEGCIMKFIITLELLEPVILSFIDFNLAGDIIDSLANIPTLRHLGFINLKCEAEREWVVHLSSRFQSYHGILSLSFMDIDDEMLVYLAAEEGLESLYLQSLYSIIPQGLAVFDNSSVKLTIKILLLY
ncbi:hypothetical protein BDA99DRAFT_542527 [Phascolomyces articulosus]|uniref:Uncharacterized protein n=1 Tax=Phascolomyces articulosus TaxID=60185 RepID=A0AAD5P8W7_9FUNG|nr:hypothetical protein BDA99DRAFT_542527 [Phascolomyces articulosus]